MIKKIFEMMIFFTCVFTGRYTLHEKLAKASPQTLFLAKYWVTYKINIFTGRQSKTKN